MKLIYDESHDEVKIIATLENPVRMIQELKLTHRHHMARPSPGIPLQIKICLHSFVFFCDDIGSLTFNRGRNTK